MNFDKLILTLLVMVFGLLTCETNNKNENEPDMTLTAEFEIDSAQLVYQYYQKFGFTDVCEDLRMVAKLKDPPKLKKRLPITPEDLKTIHAFTNKMDSINGTKISFKSNTREQFYDTELDFIEYYSDSLFAIHLTKGEYEIIRKDLTSTFKVFDHESGLFYVESHRCDGR